MKKKNILVKAQSDRFIKVALLVLSIGLLFVSCTKRHSTNQKLDDAKITKPIIAVSILPQQYFISRIAGSAVETLILVGEGQSPHSYELTPSQMASLSKAAFWLLSGTEFEINLVPKIKAQMPQLLIVDGTEGVHFRMLEEGHDHDDHEHDTNIDRHTWLGKAPAILLAQHSFNALSQILPDQKEFFEQNYMSLIAEIQSEFEALHTELAFLKGSSVLVFHPSFGYFLDEFEIDQIAIEAGGKEPSAKALSAIIEQAKTNKTPAIFVQAQFSTTAAQTISEQTGARIISLDPLAQDWLKNIKFLGEQLRTAYHIF